MKHIHTIAKQPPMRAYYVEQGPFMDFLAKALPFALDIATQDKQTA